GSIPDHRLLGGEVEVHLTYLPCPPRQAPPSILRHPALAQAVQRRDAGRLARLVQLGDVLAAGEAAQAPRTEEEEVGGERAEAVEHVARVDHGQTLPLAVFAQ